MTPESATSIDNDAVSFLSPIVKATPSKDNLLRLSGPVALYLQGQLDPQVGRLYLRAAARHMGSAIPGNDDIGKQRNEILEAISVAATICVPRSAISRSGILPALHRWMSPESSLTNSHVEFLHCCLLAGQYRYARRCVQGRWPRPHRGTRNRVLLALRYCHLRGLVHMGCEDWHWAVRCFWTVLSIPQEMLSAVSIAAWKKLVLCQCLLGRPIALPAATPHSLTQLVATRADDETHNISAYLDLIKAFDEKSNFSAIHAQHVAIWETDGNMGMVERLATELLHRKILHLASIYSVISLNQLADEVQVPPSKLPMLLSHVKGLIAAVEPDGMVCLDISSANPMPQEGLGQLLDLAEKVRKLDVSIATSTRYQHLKENTRSSPCVPRGVAEL